MRPILPSITNGKPESSLRHNRPALTAGKTSGHTLLEILVVLALVSILMIALQSPLAQFHKFVVTQQVFSDVTLGLQRFYLILKSELIQAGYGLVPQKEGFVIKNQSLFLKADLNLNGDLNDRYEQISYRFDAKKQALLRKSGKGAYQRFLRGIHELQFEYWPAKPSRFVCLKITVQILGQTQRQTTVLCPVLF